ncbi:protein btn-1-like [Exaiptasia diaphana]|uniref:Battenin n=1 Tax=Exaiptasia diaphana TaxID=2652724 RepID=A0A913XHC4_EXADI|nr:protein btn-1-like [Exaiptasia diaphana]
MENSRTRSTQNLLLQDDELEHQHAGQESVQSSRLGESPKVIAIFCSFGFMACFTAGIILTSAEDILANNSTEQTGMVWVVYSIPFIVFTAFIAWSFDRVSTDIFIVAFFPLMVFGIVLLVLPKVTWLKLVGVFLIGTVDCTSEIAALALTAYFDKIAIMAFGIGSGFSYVLSPLYYTAMTSWFQIHPKIVLMTLALHPVGFLSGYALLEKRRDKCRFQSLLSTNIKTLEATDFLPLKTKLRQTCVLLPAIMEIFLSFLFNDVVVSGITTSIVFKNSPFSPADHYKYYMLSSFAGLCLGRAYLGIVELIKPGWADKILIRRTWLLVALAMCHMIILVLASIYRFLPNVWVTMILVFSLGFWSEAVFTNITVILGEQEDSRVRELSLGMSVYGISLGNLVGSVLAKYIEKPLVAHCISALKSVRLCFTRNL